MTSDTYENLQEFQDYRKKMNEIIHQNGNFHVFLTIFADHILLKSSNTVLQNSANRIPQIVSCSKENRHKNAIVR